MLLSYIFIYSICKTNKVWMTGFCVIQIYSSKMRSTTTLNNNQWLLNNYVPIHTSIGQGCLITFNITLIKSFLKMKIKKFLKFKTIKNIITYLHL